MSSDDGKVVDLAARRDASSRRMEGTYAVVTQVEDLLTLARSDGGNLELVILAPPDGFTAWLIEESSHVEALGVALIHLSKRMKSQGGPP